MTIPPPEPTAAEIAKAAETAANSLPAGVHHLVLHQPRSRWLVRMLVMALVMSVLFNLAQMAALQKYFPGSQPPFEKFHSGELTSVDKIARIEIRGSIMPPFTDRTIQAIKKAENDEHVRGVLLVIDSPGGLVADSHQIYTRLKKLAVKKPVYVQMVRLAASGGYYVAMGAGPEAKIFAEPTTWTGSIGVIMPRYDLSKLVETYGIKSDPLTTGPFKNSLDPLKPMSPEDRELWDVILKDAFDRFLGVIDDGRADLDLDQVRALATGQVYTAKQAVENKLIDGIQYEEDTLKALQEHLKLKSARVIQYDSPAGLLDILLGSQTHPPKTLLEQLTEARTPQAMYLFGQ